MSNKTSIGMAFFGVSDKDLAVFKRVIAFIAKKGKKFHICPAENANLFIVNDNQEAIQAASSRHKSQIIILITENGNPSDSSTSLSVKYHLSHPLLITRIMRAMDESSKLIFDSAESESEQSASQKEEPAHSIQSEQANVNSETEIKINLDDKNKTSSNKISSEITQNEPTYDYHALVVDDSAAIRKQLEIELRETAISADYADCGEAALDKINNNQYDLIFLDIIMPSIDGYEVCEQLRQKKNYKKTPVIMLSGKTEPLDEVEGILAGASTYLLKPVKHEDFQKMLKRISRWLSEYNPVS